jgi:hypothetical protein
MDNIQLNISKEDAQDFLDIYSQKRQSLISDNEPVFTKLREYDTKIKKLQDLLGLTKKDANTDLLKGVTPEYPKEGSWNKKIKYFLSQNPSGLSSSQIVDLIMEKDNIKDKKKLIGIPPTLSMGASAEKPIYDRNKGTNGEWIYKIKK